MTPPPPPTPAPMLRTSTSAPQVIPHTPQLNPPHAPASSHYAGTDPFPDVGAVVYSKAVPVNTHYTPEELERSLPASWWGRLRSSPPRQGDGLSSSTWTEARETCGAAGQSSARSAGGARGGWQATSKDVDLLVRTTTDLQVVPCRGVGVRVEEDDEI